MYAIPTNSELDNWENTPCDNNHNCSNCEYDCEQPPKDWWIVKYVDDNAKTCIVKEQTSRWSTVADISKDIRFLFDVGDYVKLIFSPASRKWTAIDYMAGFNYCGDDDL